VDFLSIVNQLNSWLEVPATVTFFAVAIILTIKLRFIQLRSFKRFMRLLTRGVATDQQATYTMQTVSPVQALFMAMATTIGIGNVVSPSLAIIVGGPGAMFWLLAYIIFAMVTKYTEVTFALFTRKRDDNGFVLGGPTQYLRLAHPWIANWYGLVTIFLFASWSGCQSSVLAEILQEESIPTWVTGAGLALLVILVCFGGVKRIGALASKLVPVMFVSYVTFSLLILYNNFGALQAAINLVLQHIFTPAAAIGGFAGASVFQAMKSGAYQAAFITEAGVGTSSIPHSVSDAKRPSDQGILAMYSMLADGMLCMISGMLVLVTGVWQGKCEMTGRLIYEVFKDFSPAMGKWVLLFSICLFAITTVVGNGFNGAQSFGSFTHHRGVKFYFIFVAGVVFLSTISPVPAVWQVMSLLLILVVLPNLLSLLYLAWKHPKVLEE
jgi:AGCS family alanine or glycine:cation symporter